MHDSFLFHSTATTYWCTNTMLGCVNAWMQADVEWEITWYGCAFRRCRSNLFHHSCAFHLFGLRCLNYQYSQIYAHSMYRCSRMQTARLHWNYYNILFWQLVWCTQLIYCYHKTLVNWLRTIILSHAVFHFFPSFVCVEKCECECHLTNIAKCLTTASQFRICFNSGQCECSNHDPSKVMLM